MSTEYTPTTEQVRDGYRYDPIAEYHDPITPHHIHGGRAFDRWLAEHDRQVKADAWDEAYQAGVEDQWTSEAMQAGVTPNRINPYRQESHR